MKLVVRVLVGGAVGMLLGLVVGAAAPAPRLTGIELAVEQYGTREPIHCGYGTARGVLAIAATPETTGTLIASKLTIAVWHEGVDRSWVHEVYNVEARNGRRFDKTRHRLEAAGETYVQATVTAPDGTIFSRLCEFVSLAGT